MKNDYISEIHKKDKHVLHPYEDLQSRGTYKRKLIVKSDNIYLYDEEGKRYIDGPGGMWCNNIGHGNEEIAEAIKKQIVKMDYCSPFSESTEVAAELASVLSDLSPGDLNTIFFTSDGSTANDSALRFVMYYNNILGRKEKKHIITRDRAYHGSTYLTGSITGKDREKNSFDFETNFIHHLSSPNPYRRKENQTEEEFIYKTKFIDEQLYSAETSILTSKFSQLGILRTAVSAYLNMYVRKNILSVVEGRDIGSVVFKDAVMKIYIDSPVELRAKRRLSQSSNKEGIDNIVKRDEMDKMRDNSPLIIPDGAFILLNEDQSLEEIVDLLEEEYRNL